MQDTPHLPSGCSQTEVGGVGGRDGRGTETVAPQRDGYLDRRMSKVLSAQRRGPKISRESGQGRLPGGRRHP